ncbi:MAG: methyltransferase type 12 [Melioribacteraceae bacterium]|nr:methyltransferase type 12 [Melioribacteraceae bacterium]
MKNKSNNCSPNPLKEEITLKEHWNKAYSNNNNDKLGWFETDVTPSLNMMEKTGLSTTARIMIVGAGSTTLIDQLLKMSYSNILATDISEISLIKLKERLGKECNKIELIVDDLTNPVVLNRVDPVHLWIDRAVLHFFTEEKEQNRYFTLLKQSVKQNGFVLFAEFNLEGASSCSGLPVKRYSKEMLIEKLGSDFRLVDSFNHIYTMPSGNKRPYIYALFKREAELTTMPSA